MAHESVIEATVVSIDHERWQERPVAYVHVDGEVTEAQLNEHLLTDVPKWWLPDQFVFTEEIPRTSTGKYDKKALRQSFENEYDSLPLSEG